MCAQWPNWVTPFWQAVCLMLCCMAGNMATPKARALGAALREAREERGLSLRKLASELDRDPSLLSRWETGKRAPQAIDVAQILTHLGVNGARYDEIVHMTEGADAAQWLAITLPEQRQQLAALLDFEDTADTITTASPLLIPGLLQESGYVRAIMSAGTVPADEIATRVAVRIGRRDVITRRDPARLVAFIGESALRQVIGGPTVMADQLTFLLEAASWVNVELRVIPYASGWHPALEGPFTIIDPKVNAERATTPVVHIENRRSGLFLHEKEDVDTYRQAVDAVLLAAMSPTDTEELIAAVIKEMRT
jgi:transcriptional regulator with XRE-family HTH domain